jgi:hypothetical protein
MNHTMAPPHSRQRDGSTGRALRTELGALADALVDARPADRSDLRVRVSHAVDAHRRLAGEQDELSRLLQHMMSDLSREAAPLDTLYYARQLVVAAERLPN